MWQPRDLAAGFDLKELPVPTHNNVAANPVSIFGPDTCDSNDLAACQQALALAQKVNRTWGLLC